MLELFIFFQKKMLVRPLFVSYRWIRMSGDLMIKYRKFVIFWIGLIVLIRISCYQKYSISAEQIIMNAVHEKEKPFSYYGDITVKTIGNEDEVESIIKKMNGEM